MGQNNLSGMDLDHRLVHFLSWNLFKISARSFARMCTRFAHLCTRVQCVLRPFRLEPKFVCQVTLQVKYRRLGAC